jgi:hypothetical protein
MSFFTYIIAHYLEQNVNERIAGTPKTASGSARLRIRKPDGSVMWNLFKHPSEAAPHFEVRFSYSP